MTKKRLLSLYHAVEEIGLPVETVTRFVAFRWIIPADWQHQILDDEDIARARLIGELQREFGVNDDAVPIILSLVDQLNRVRWEAEHRGDANDP